MSKGWTWNSRLLRYKKIYPKKGFGLIWEKLLEYWPWEIWLLTGMGKVADRYTQWVGGEADTLEEAKKIVDDTFDLIGEVEGE